MESMQKLVEKATWNKLTREEIDHVTRIFYSSTLGKDQDLAACIYILGRIGADQHRPAIEKHLCYPTDAHVSAVTLQVLGLYWKYTEDYLNEIVSFIKGVDWDLDDEVRMMAFSVLGSYLRKKFNPQLVKLLTDFVEDPTKIEGYDCDRLYAQAFLQACAFVALSRAFGSSWDVIPDEDEIEKIIEEGRAHELVLVQEARAFLAKQHM